MESMDILEKLRKQDRLISESAVMKSVQKAIIEMGYEPFEEKVMGIYTAIDNTPTAYDVEKVVAELEELANHNGNAYLDSADVIDIVKRGGAE